MVSSSSVIELVILQVSVAFSPGLIIALIINESVQKRIRLFDVRMGSRAYVS